MLLGRAFLLALLLAPGALLAQTAQKSDADHRAVRARSVGRRHRAHDRERAWAAARTTDGGREQAGRRRLARLDGARQGAARRRYAQRRRDRRAGHQPASARRAAVRSAARARSDCQAHRRSARHRCQCRQRPEIDQGADRAVEGDARRPELRLDRHQFGPASHHGAAQEGDRRQSRPCPLPWQRARGHRRSLPDRFRSRWSISPRRIRTSRPARCSRSACRMSSGLRWRRTSRPSPKPGSRASGASAGSSGCWRLPARRPPIVKRLSREVGAILAVPEVQAKVRLLSVEPAYEDDVAFARMLAEELAKWKELLQSLPVAN